MCLCIRQIKMHLKKGLRVEELNKRFNRSDGFCQRIYVHVGNFLARRTGHFFVHFSNLFSLAFVILGQYNKIKMTK